MLNKSLHFLRSALLALLLAGGSGAAPVNAAEPAQLRPLIVFTSDFGTLDDAVAICKGVMKTISPATEIIDLTHQVTPFSISEGARLLVRTSQYYPSGTVFVTVVDPGVGTARKPVVVRTRRGQYFVLPDNGLVTQVVDRDGLAGVREIRNPTWLLATATSSTFHGRDLFAPVAAHLARGEVWTDVGPALPGITRLEVPQAVTDTAGIRGLVVALDGPYGNLVTNVGSEEFRKLGYALGQTVHLSVGEKTFALAFGATFGAVAPGQPLLFIDSRGLVSLAINQGNFAATNGIAPPERLVIRRP